MFNFKASHYYFFCFLTFQRRFLYYFGLSGDFYVHHNFFPWLLFPLWFLFARVKSPKSARYLNTCSKLRPCLSALLTWSQGYFLKSFKCFRTWIQNVLQKFQISSISCANNSCNSVLPSDDWSSGYGKLLNSLTFRKHASLKSSASNPRALQRTGHTYLYFSQWNITGLLAVVLQ